MPITRAKASQLLNQKELALYDESRINGLRQLDSRAISTRITRARAARDRARDLVRRQKLSSRADTGSKRGTSGSANQRSKDKAELMADILGRFETRLREVDGKEAGTGTRSATKKAAPAKRVAKKAAKRTGAKSPRKAAKPAQKVATKVDAKTSKKRPPARTATRTATKKAATTPKSEAATAAGKKAGTAAGRKAATRAGKKAAMNAPAPRAAKKSAAGKAKSAGSTRLERAGTTTARGGADGATGNPVNAGAAPASAKRGRRPSSDAAGKTATSRSRPRKRAITPEQALAQTQALLEAKQARDQEPKPWAQVADGGVDPGTPGYQSESAARRAKRLHAAETRLPAIQGSVSTRDRINQGKRDHRGDTGE